MKTATPTSIGIEEYIALQDKEIQTRLKKIRSIIKKSAPKAAEAMAYGMSGYKLNGSLVYFGAFKNHIGFYPIPSGIKKFERELSKYKTTKGAIQFPHDEPIPYPLIEKIVKFRVKENMEKK